GARTRRRSHPRRDPDFAARTRASRRIVAAGERVDRARTARALATQAREAHRAAGSRTHRPRPRSRRIAARAVARRARRRRLRCRSARRDRRSNVANGARVKPRTWIAIGALVGGASVALGAFGAHALKARLDAEHLELWRLAAFYQSIHAAALV